MRAIYLNVDNYQQTGIYAAKVRNSRDPSSHARFAPRPQKQEGNPQMESRIRTLLKALTWQVLGLLTMTAIGLVHTGSITAGMSLAASSMVVGFVCFLIHERIWNAVRWGRRAGS
jgi:uncharacterized membrane protein